MAAPRCKWHQRFFSCARQKAETDLLLVTAELEVLASLEGELVLRLARGALETQDDLLGLHVSASAGGIEEGGVPSWPSCGRRAWSDHRNQTAFLRTFSAVPATRRARSAPHVHSVPPSSMSFRSSSDVPHQEPKLTVVSTLSLGGSRVLALLVLRHLVRGVLAASLVLAVWRNKL